MMRKCLEAIERSHTAKQIFDLWANMASHTQRLVAGIGRGHSMSIVLSDRLYTDLIFDMHPSANQNPYTQRMLKRMPAEISATFSPTQIQAIESAISPHQHAIDLRLTLPLPGQGIYLVFLAGRNRRAYYRDLQNRHSLIMPIVMAGIIAGAAAIFALIHLKNSQTLTESNPVFEENQEFYPTVVPFKKDRKSCEESERQWIDGQCLDTIHDPNF
ncbi:hypothetical protein [Leptolyngbya sp. BC1307]|uniref:hypothetical protein n=1 Tax=Leptolyngbya sp. BC1307 TaxID=2029589 RepID=UPI000EFA42AB|nr:hypothetical protein [Leptolyngbya sp. BC1307]